MIVHGRRRGLAVACRDGLDDGFVLGQRHVQAAARVEHAAHAFEAKPCRLGGVAHPAEAELVLQHGMEGEIEVVEALGVSAVDGGLLVAQVLAQCFGEFGRGRLGDPAGGFHLQRPAQEHVLARIGNADEGHARTALRNDLDETLGRQPAHGFGHRKARDAEPRGNGLLVQRIAGLQLERNNGFPQQGMGPGRRSGLARGPVGRQKIIGDGDS